VKIGERAAFDEVDGCSVIIGGLTWKACNDVGTDRGIRELVANEFDAARVVFGAIPAMHGGEDAVGTGLQRHVKMLRDARSRNEERDEVGGNVERFDRADAEASDVGFVEDQTQEVFEFNARIEIAAPGAEVDAAENDFAIACGGEAANFGDDFNGRHAAALAADERNDAVGAAEIAAVLDF
jgi:hypothetical protein